MFDPYRKWLGISDANRPPTHYQLLAIDPAETDPEVIRAAVMQRSAYVRNFQSGNHADDATRILNEIAAAEACLTNLAKRSAYDAELKRKQPKQRVPASAAPAAPRVDPLLEQAAAMTTLSAPWAISPLTARRRTPNYLPLAFGGGTFVVVVVILGMVLASMLGDDGDAAKEANALAAAADATPEAPPADMTDTAPPPSSDNTPATTSADPQPADPSGENASAATVEVPTTVASAGQAVSEETTSVESGAEAEAGNAVDLLKLIDPARDSVSGRWFFEKGVLISPGQHSHRLQIPYDLPDAYTLTIVATRAIGEDGLPLGVVIGGRQCLLAIDSYGSISGLSHFDGKNETENVTRHEGPAIVTGKEFTLVCQVRRAGITATVDGQVIVDWNGSPERLSLGGNFWIAGRRWLFLGNGLNVEYHFSSIRLEPLEEPPLDFGTLTAELADLANWTERGGEWSAEAGCIAGKGDGSLEFKRRFPQDFQFEATVTVRAGTRLRLLLGGSDLAIGSDGAGHKLWLHGDAQSNLEGRPFAYQPNSPFQLGVRLYGPLTSFSVNGKTVATALRNKIGPVQLALQPGDGASPGDVEFRDLRVTAPVLDPAEALAALSAAGATVEEIRRGGKPALRIAMQGIGATDYVLGYVRWLPDARELILNGSAVTDAACRYALVTSTLLCPAASRTSARVRPPARAWLMNVCRPW